MTNWTHTVSGDGFVKEESISCSYTGSQTEVGSSKNTFDYGLKNGTKASNYTITKVEGLLRVVRLYKYLRKQKESVIAKQMLRSGASIGANIAESRCAQSKADFASKLQIALKEASETEYWLEGENGVGEYGILPKMKVCI